METQIETINIPCYFCAKTILIAKIDTVKTTYAPSMYCADCLSKHRSGVNISEIKRQRELKENDKRLSRLPLTFALCSNCGRKNFETPTCWFCHEKL